LNYFDISEYFLLYSRVIFGNERFHSASANPGENESDKIPERKELIKY
jgi:hypothetical protein